MGARWLVGVALLASVCACVPGPPVGTPGQAQEAVAVSDAAVAILYTAFENTLRSIDGAKLTGAAASKKADEIAATRAALRRLATTRAAEDYQLALISLNALSLGVVQ